MSSSVPSTRWCRVYLISPINHIASMHQARSMSYIGSVYHWLNFWCWSHIFITFLYHYDCLLLDVLLYPYTTSLSGTTFRVSYRHTIGPSASVVDYIITHNICCSHCRGNTHSSPGHMTCITFLWKKILPALLSEGLNIGLALVNRMSEKRCVLLLRRSFKSHVFNHCSFLSIISLTCSR